MGIESAILLETGTNELEIVEFRVGSGNYGINVAKVREVIPAVKVTFLPQMHPYLEGVFTLRGKVLPLVSLFRCLHVPDNESDYKVIVAELNGYRIGFKVSVASKIHRISWQNVAPSPAAYASELTTSLVKMDDRMIILLDFEKILSEIYPDINRKLTTLPDAVDDKSVMELRNQKKIYIAEDSKMLRDLLVSTLHTAGYLNLNASENGQEAWDRLNALTHNSGSIHDYVDLVITDIEMPQMDGHHLTRRIKENDKLKELPVIIFSSLINEEMKRKGEACGAAAQITKPEIAELVTILDQLLTSNQ